jgi:hypothetical protein
MTCPGSIWTKIRQLNFWIFHREAAWSRSTGPGPTAANTNAACIHISPPTTDPRWECVPELI